MILLQIQPTKLLTFEKKVFPVQSMMTLCKTGSSLSQALNVLIVASTVSSISLKQMENRMQCNGTMLDSVQKDAALNHSVLTTNIASTVNANGDMLYKYFQLLRETIKSIPAEAIERDTSERGMAHYHVIAPLIDTLARRMGSSSFNLAMEILEIDSRTQSYKKWKAVSGLLHRFGFDRLNQGLANAQKTESSGLGSDLNISSGIPVNLPLDTNLYCKLRGDWWKSLIKHGVRLE